MLPLISVLSSILQLLPLKSLENHRFSDDFRGKDVCCRILESTEINGSIGTKWVNIIPSISKGTKDNVLVYFSSKLKKCFPPLCGTSENFIKTRLLCCTFMWPFAGTMVMLITEFTRHIHLPSLGVKILNLLHQ